MKKILLLGSYGRRNIGDDIYLKLFLEQLDDFEVHFNCWDTKNIPEEIELKSSHVVMSTSLSGIPKILLSLLQCKVLVYGGGELWMRLDGTRIPNLSTYKMLLINTVAKVLRKKVYYISNGSEPLTGWARIAASWSARLATKLYLRDAESARILKLKKTKYEVIPDIAYLLKVQPVKKHRSQVAISATNYISQKDSPTSNHLEDLSTFLKNSTTQKNIVLLSAMSDPNAIEKDQIAIEELKRQLGSSGILYEYSSIDDFVKQLSESKLIISYRLHVNILGHLAHVPTIGIGYRPKVEKFFETFSTLDAYCSISNMNTDLTRAHKNLNSSSKVQHRKTAETIKQAQEEYDTIFTEIRGLYSGL